MVDSRVVDMSEEAEKVSGLMGLRTIAQKDTDELLYIREGSRK
jgi:hypothetical protein